MLFIDETKGIHVAHLHDRTVKGTVNNGDNDKMPIFLSQ